MPDTQTRPRARVGTRATDLVPTGSRGLSLRALMLGLVTAAIAVLTCASAATAAPSCPASTTLAPGSQDSPVSAVLYCGGTYSDTWDAANETDWIAFYTAQASATVVAHYVSSWSGEGPQDPILAILFDQGSATEGPELVKEGPYSWGNLESVGLAYTFSTPGLHYVQMTAEFTDWAEEGNGYELSLSGEWSQTPPQPEPPASVPPSPSTPSSKESKPAPAPMPCVVPPLERDVRAKVIKERISEAHCAVGRISYVHRQRVAKGIVVALNPRSGTHLAHGAKVSVVVSSGPDQRGHARRRPHGRNHRNRHATQQSHRLHDKAISSCPEVYIPKPPAPLLVFSHIRASGVSCRKVRSLILRYIYERSPAYAGQWHCVYRSMNGTGSIVGRGRCTKDRAYFRFTEEQE